MEEESEDIAIGIDLGTTFSCVAAFHNNRLKIIPSDFGGNYTPSYVYIGGDGEKVGLEAKEESFLSPHNTVWNIKKLLGLPFNNDAVQKDLPQWPFKVVGHENLTKLLVNGEYYHPEQIAAKLLYHLRKQAETHLKKTITQAVITVPAYFNEGQRQATKDSATIAGFKRIRILNETTATAIAYCHQSSCKPSTKETILIFDFGGGYLDVALATVENNAIKIVAVGGDTFTGGQDIDTALMAFCIKERRLNLENEKKSFFSSDRLLAWKKLQVLRNQCENLKINLSKSKRESLDFGRNGKVEITREQFDQLLNAKLYEKCLHLIDEVITEAGITKDTIDEVILVGGSSKIPKLREMVSEYFSGKYLFDHLNKDQSVACGAAIVASTVFGNNRSKIIFRDVVSVPVGIQLKNPQTDRTYFQIVIRKHCYLPCSKFVCSKTREDGQVPKFIIRQGKDIANVQNNFLIGEFIGENWPLKFPRGTNFYLTLHLNEEGMLHLEAMYETKFRYGKMYLKRKNNRLSLGDIVRLRVTELSLK